MAQVNNKDNSLEILNILDKNKERNNALISKIDKELSEYSQNPEVIFEKLQQRGIEITNQDRKILESKGIIGNAEQEKSQQVNEINKENDEMEL